jgi:CBS domain-containing protein
MSATSLRARDLMKRDVVCVRAATRIHDVRVIFLDRAIHGAPVLDELDRIDGFISALDLLRAPADATVAESMSREPVVVGPDTAIGDISRLMYDYHAHHVLVAENRMLRGVISSYDLLRALFYEPIAVRHTGYSR